MPIFVRTACIVVYKYSMLIVDPQRSLHKHVSSARKMVKSVCEIRKHYSNSMTIGIDGMLVLWNNHGEFDLHKLNE